MGICGGSGSGKTTLAARIVSRIRASRGFEAATVASFDAYYHDQVHLPLGERATVNYDHPDSLDAELLGRHLRELHAGNDVAVPVYDFESYTRTSELRLVPAADIVVVEGILLFSFEAVRSQLDFSVFRDCPESVRFERRIGRDMAERGRSRASILTQLAATVKPMHDRYVQPFLSRADYVTHHGEDLQDAGRQIADHVLDLHDQSLAGPALSPPRVPREAGTTLRT